MRNDRKKELEMGFYIIGGGGGGGGVSKSYQSSSLAQRWAKEEFRARGPQFEEPA